MTTDPTQVMRAAIRGIAVNKLYVFPDVVQAFYILTRYSLSKGVG